MLKHLVDVSLCNSCSQVLVIAGHHHLHQVLVAHHLILIRVKVADDIVCICFCSLFHAIVSVTAKVLNEISTALMELTSGI